MKKLSRKIILSLIAVLFAVITLGTSTYAWLSMNTAVTATGLQVTAKTESKFLLIGTGDDDTAAEIQAKSPAQITVDLAVAANASQVFPSAPRATGDGLSIGSVVTNTSTANTVGNWYVRTADDPSASASTSAPTALTTFDNYVIHKTVYITLSQGSTDATNLKVSATTFTSNSTATGNSTTLAPVKCLVTSSSAAVELTSTSLTSDTILAATVTDQAVVQIDIYIYYDGNHSAVYTNNVANLDGATFTLSFTVQ